MSDEEILRVSIDAYEKETGGIPVKNPDIPGPAELRLAQILINMGYKAYDRIPFEDKKYYFYKLMAFGYRRIGWERDNDATIGRRLR